MTFSFLREFLRISISNTNLADEPIHHLNVILAVIIVPIPEAVSNVQSLLGLYLLFLVIVHGSIELNLHQMSIVLPSNTGAEGNPLD